MGEYCKICGGQMSILWWTDMIVYYCPWCRGEDDDLSGPYNKTDNRLGGLRYVKIPGGISIEERNAVEELNRFIANHRKELVLFDNYYRKYNYLFNPFDERATLMILDKTYIPDKEVAFKFYQAVVKVINAINQNDNSSQRQYEFYFLKSIPDKTNIFSTCCFENKLYFARTRKGSCTGNDVGALVIDYTAMFNQDSVDSDMQSIYRMLGNVYLCRNVNNMLILTGSNGVIFKEQGKTACFAEIPGGINTASLLKDKNKILVAGNQYIGIYDITENTLSTLDELKTKFKLVNIMSAVAMPEGYAIGLDTEDRPALFLPRSWKRPAEELTACAAEHIQEIFYWKEWVLALEFSRSYCIRFPAFNSQDHSRGGGLSMAQNPLIPDEFWLSDIPNGIKIVTYNSIKQMWEVREEFSDYINKSIRELLKIPDGKEIIVSCINFIDDKVIIGTESFGTIYCKMVDDEYNRKLLSRLRTEISTAATSSRSVSIKTKNKNVSMPDMRILCKLDKSKIRQYDISAMKKVPGNPVIYSACCFEQRLYLSPSYKEKIFSDEKHGAIVIDYELKGTDIIFTETRGEAVHNEKVGKVFVCKNINGNLALGGTCGLLVKVPGCEPRNIKITGGVNTIAPMTDRDCLLVAGKCNIGVYSIPDNMFTPFSELFNSNKTNYIISATSLPHGIAYGMKDKENKYAVLLAQTGTGYENAIFHNVKAPISQIYYWKKWILIQTFNEGYCIRFDSYNVQQLSFGGGLAMAQNPLIMDEFWMSDNPRGISIIYYNEKTKEWDIKYKFSQYINTAIRQALHIADEDELAVTCVSFINDNIFISLKSFGSFILKPTGI